MLRHQVQERKGGDWGVRERLLAVARLGALWTPVGAGRVFGGSQGAGGPQGGFGVGWVVSGEAGPRWVVGTVPRALRTVPGSD